MAGDTFDAGTVYAEARLDRDQMRRDITAARRDLARFERDARVSIKPRFDNSEIETGVNQARAWLKSLSEYKVTPTVELNDQTARDAAVIRALLRALGQQKARPTVDPDIDPAQRKIALIRAQIEDLRRQRGLFLGIDIDTGGLERAGGSLLRIMRNASLAASATALLGNSFFALSSLSVSLVHAAGGLGMILPAALMVGVGAAATLALGMQGVGDAMKAAAEGDAEKLNEALSKLAPSAREFVLETQRIRPAWQAMQLEVQQQLFLGMAQAMGVLAGRYLPMLRTELGGIAVELRETALQTAAWLAGGTQVDTIRQILQGVRLSIDGLNPALAAILSIFLDLAVVGMEFLPGWARGFSEAATGAAEFIRNARESGQLKQWMSEGLSALGEFITLLTNIGSILWSVFSAADSVGGGFLATLVLLTGELRTFLNSAAGTEFLVTFFTTLRGVIDQLMSGVRAVGGALVGAFQTLAPHIPLVAQAFSTVAIALVPIIGLVAQLISTLLPPLLTLIIAMGPAIGPVVTGLLAMYGAFKLLSGVTAIITAIRTAWLLLNIAFAASPVGLVITGVALAIVGLVAGFTYLWNTSEGFRNFWIGLWEGVKSAVATAWSVLQTIWTAITTAITAVGTAAVWLWQNVFVPAWNAITTATQAVGNAFVWLWENAIKPAFDFISLAARTLLAIVVTIVLAPIILAVKAVGAVFTWLWENAIGPAFQAIGDFVTMVWNTYIKPVFDAVVSFIQTTFTTAWNWLRDTAIAVWTAIQTGISAAWTFIRDNIWNPIVTFLQATLGPVFELFRDLAIAGWNAVRDALGAVWNFIRDNIWNPLVGFINGTIIPAFNVVRDAIITAWNTIRDALATAWNAIRDNVFEPVRRFVMETIPGAFNTAVDAISSAWNKIREVVAAPIRFMVNLVYNEGIVPAWNFVAGLVGLGKLDKVNLGFATGGVVPGYAPGVDRVPAMLSPGEGVVRPEVTRAIGPAGIEQLNLAAMRGGVSGVVRYLRTGGERSADYKQRFAAGGVAAGQAFARGEAGKPYVWGGVGPGGYDCSGFMSAITNVALGRNPHSRLFATGSFGAGRGAGGFVPGTNSAFVIGVSPDTGSGIGHMAGNIGGLNVESRGGNGVVVGGAARGPTDRLFPWQFYLPQVLGRFIPGAGGVDIWGEFMKLWGKVVDFMGRTSEFMGTAWGQGGMGILKTAVDGIFALANEKVLGTPVPVGQATGPGAGNYFDQGGVIQPGWNHVYNGTGKPELAGRTDQWASLIDSARVQGGMESGGGNATVVTLERLNATIAELKELIERRGTGAVVNVYDESGDSTQTGRTAALAIRMS